MGFNSLTAHEWLSVAKRQGADAGSMLDDIYARIDAVEGKVHSFAHIKEKARVLIEAGRSSSGPLKGVPVAIKDNLCEKGEPTTCSSRILAGFRPPYDATVVAKLKAAGAAIFAKTNMDEFAFGSSCETSCYGPTRNPWNLDAVPGGSSGGSAACVAADEAIMALGSDTGGSIRQPAALCGVVGLKPTYGRVSRYGLIAFASSLDQIGPITKDVADAALALNAIAGHDERDSTSADLPVPDYTRSLIENAKGLTFGVPKEYFVEGMSGDVRDAVNDAMAVLERRGARMLPISLPHTRYAVSAYYIIATAEASSNLARFDGVQYGLRSYAGGNIIDMYSETRAEGFGDEAKRRIMLGTYVLSSGYYDAYYLKGLKARTRIKEDFDSAFKECDVILTPTSPTAAFRLGEKTTDPLSMYLSDIYTISANLAGVPAISIPCGFTKDNLPVGLQLLAAPFREEALFRAAFTFENATDHHKAKPPL